MRVCVELLLNVMSCPYGLYESYGVVFEQSANDGQSSVLAPSIIGQERNKKQGEKTKNEQEKRTIG